MSKNTKYRFYVTSIGKFRYYDDLEDVLSDLSLKEIKGSEIDIVYRARIIGTIDPQKFYEESEYEVADKAKELR